MNRVFNQHLDGKDPASRAYRINRLIADVPIRGRHWATGRQLDQGATGHCGGFGAAAEAAASPERWLGISEFWAHSYYYAIKRQQLDPWGLEDGTSSLAVMKLGVQLGLWETYHWALDGSSLADIKRGLEVGPVAIGVPWTTGMMKPDVDGMIRATGNDEGGHFTLLTGWSPSYLNHGEVYKIRNSWGSAWGKNGSAYIPADDLFDVVVTRQGEAAIPTQRKRQ